MTSGTPMLNRRGFAKLLLGGAVSIAATPLLKVAAIAKTVWHSDTAKSAFGWMEGDKITFTEVIQQTFKRKAPEIEYNVTKYNSLFENYAQKTVLDVANDWTPEDIERISAKLIDRMDKKKYIVRREDDFKEPY